MIYNAICTEIQVTKEIIIIIKKTTTTTTKKKRWKANEQKPRTEPQHNVVSYTQCRSREVGVGRNTHVGGGGGTRKPTFLQQKVFLSEKKIIEETLLGIKRTYRSRISSQSTLGLRCWKAGTRRVELKKQKGGGEGGRPRFLLPPLV